MFYACVGAEILRIGRVSNSVDNFIAASKILTNLISTGFFDVEKFGININGISMKLTRNIYQRKMNIMTYCFF